jgi:hypothetical protein
MLRKTTPTKTKYKDLFLSDWTDTAHMSSGAPLPTVQGLRTRDLWRNRELSRQPGPSPHDQAVVGPRTSEVSSDAKDRELPRSAPMEIDAPEPPPGRVRTVQRPIYYISEVLHEAKTRYGT